MALPNRDPERFDASGTVDLPRKSMSKLLLPEHAIPKAEVPATAKILVDNIREFSDSLTGLVMIKQAIEVLKSAKDQIMDYAMLKMEGKEMEVFGATVSRRRVTEYQYDDPTLSKWEREAEELKAKIDERRKFMRLIKTPQADTTTGEEVQPAKLIRDGETLAVKFK